MTDKKRMLSQVHHIGGGLEAGGLEKASADLGNTVELLFLASSHQE